MPIISKEKKKKISEQILYYIFSIFPKSEFTSKIAQEMARDEEFVKSILIELQKQNLVVKIEKNTDGISYKKRLKWRISNKAYEAYKTNQ
jgi:hypothetical protein